MNVLYRQTFLKDLKRLKNTPVYDRLHTLAFTTLPQTQTLPEIANVKALEGTANCYRIRIGDYRLGIQLEGDTVELLRVLHRRDFYRYFP